MIIETKFSIGDVVYFVHENKLHSDKIGSIKTSLYNDGSGSIIYTLNSYYNGYDLAFTEKDNRLFSKPVELYSSLEKNIVARNIDEKTTKNA